MTRYAIVTNALGERSADAYLPGNYKIVASREYPGRDGFNCVAFLIAGEDVAGWTLDGYVEPRYASGLIQCREVSQTGAVNFNLGSPLDACV